MLLLIFVPILALLFWLWWKREKNENEPPEYVFKLEWHKLHNVVNDGERLWRRTKKMSAECLKRDGTMQMTVGPRTVYVITDPDDFLTVSNACLEKDPFYNFSKNWLGNGLITAPTSKWKVHRKLLNPLFGQRSIDSLIEVFNNVSRQLVENLEVEVGKGPFDHYPYTRRNALDTICSLKFKPFIRVLLEMFSNSDAFTDSDIRQHVDTFVVAGEDTTAGVTMYCMLLVGSYSQVQDKIYEEIKDIFGDDERDVTKEDLSKLVYLEAVLKETMRYYPIVPIIGRHLDKDVKLRNCTLSRGRTAILSIYGIHRHPMWGPDADEFKPERWLAPLSNIQKMFAGFSMGRRICIGKTYAMASLKVRFEMLLLILLWTLVFLFWIWLKKDANKDEPPTFFTLDWRKLYRITENTEGFWNLIKEMSRECQKRDGVMKLAIGPRTVYVLTDPEDCLTVSNACLEKDSVYDFAKNWIGNGLITSSLPIWKMHRKLLNPLFNARILNNFMEIFNSLSHILIKNLEVEVGKGPFDPYVYSRRYALELICSFDFEPLAEIILKICENNTQFTDQDIRQHIDTFIAAGEDTSAGVIMLCLVTVGSYPRVQEEIYKELKQIFGDEDRDVTKEDLTKLVYLDAVIKETMRFYPMVPAIARYVDKNVKLRNCTLSKGRTAIVSIYGIHRHPMWGPDADEFRPERWLSPPSSYYKYFAAFSLGRRICIGKTMANAALKVTMAHIFRKYVIHGDHTNMKLKYELTLKAISGQYITIERRNKKQ
ncbi:unnamed protein product [Danaus chrysippus]|uniref:(African queen) hypothetical protein n=1 Tax=Danaus chrysippus TaxID=151541 RepID=A0A8J2QRG1_9NEOP|nr:unnamed protein product [Danaus chrysippus]